MNIMKNKPLIFSLIWFNLLLYGLLRESQPSDIHLFPNFDKIMHFLLFFCQIWLIVKIFLTKQKHIPYVTLGLFALMLAVGTEWAQATFTTTRSADILDALADILGAIAALLLAKKIDKIYTRQYYEK